MAAGQDDSSFDEGCGDEPDRGNQRAPIRQTLAGEMDGLFRFAAARLGGRTQWAQDAVQQVMVIAMAHPSPPAEVPSQRAWLRGILRNVIRRQARTWRRDRQAVSRAAFEQASSQAQSATAAGSSGDEARARTVQALYLAVTELDGGDQDLFHAFYRAGRSHASIAAELGTTVKGVEARLYRLRSRLRSALEQAGERLP